MEDSSVNSDLNCRGLVKKISEERNFSMLPRNHSCGILGKNVAGLCSCPKYLSEAKVNSFGLIPWQRSSQDCLALTLLCGN